jgi:hypothetical protein
LSNAINAPVQREVLVTKLLPPTTDLEPNSKQVTFDIVLVTG